ncbi:Apl5p NDAI_0F01700 [Naumovozyma dairenensis CBS 421]|uniref:AP-3 complex subunit delta n=1 Tax=Naumovozyma dairenensis (strain ATCC 10597 / BCRC 20456 / CBS 421 / NBRC 0211 / NRRL Y-12639) TaxID=1071378 RepID=G0WCH8_NAUDC|nr:hypothetical protein NDAI_0F01700 [Naumovozyma dairenensis CBS 421]CCD25489.1 hypothetical protein NDAI_0F01700 [Naumovozyma dairenensis CBS 421]
MTSLYAPTTTDVRQRLRPFGFFFEKSLKDLIKGIRSNNETPEKLHQFLSEVLTECRNEANSPDMTLKTNAILKLTYLEMYGFDMSWCNFHVLEVMSSNKLQQKRVGYLAASQSFYKDKDILMLATNLLKKDLKYSGSNNSDVIKVGIALNGLSTIVTPSLAADIADDLFSMLNSSNPYIRKKAITALFKVFLQYPEALRDNFDKFASKLEDDDTSVVSATVSVICELSKKNPKPFIQLSPILYEILINIDNNWIIIRLLKLFTNLSQVEPKLRPKLLPKILELMEVTMATSVIYESINCIVKGCMLQDDDHETAMFCLDKLHSFCDSQDPNLRYISCCSSSIKLEINTSFISQFDKLIMRLLLDMDVSIRSKAIELLDGIVSQENTERNYNYLMRQFINEETIQTANNSFSYSDRQGISIIIPESYKQKLVKTIIQLCSMENYSNIIDFGWFTMVLSDLATISIDLSNEDLGVEIGRQFRNIMVKVPSLRELSMRTIINITSNEDIRLGLSSILKDCFWCIGEFSNFIANGDTLIQLILKNIYSYPPDVQQIIIPALLKILGTWCQNETNPIDVRDVKLILKQLIEYFESSSYSRYFELQERSVEALEFLKLSVDSMESDDHGLPLLLSDVLPSMFKEYELKPLAYGTQRQVQYNEIIDLETPFLTDAGLRSISENVKYDYTEDSNSLFSDLDTDENSPEELESSLNEEYPQSGVNDLSRQEKKEQLSNPYYLNKLKNEKNIHDNDLLNISDETIHSPESLSAKIKLVNKDQEQSPSPNSSSRKIGRNLIPVTVLADEVINTNGSTRQTLASKENTFHPAHSKGKINFNIPSKLESFDFSSSTNIHSTVDIDDRVVDDNDTLELEKLRNKFTEASGEEVPEEVVIIKKKKKKNKEHRKSKSKNQEKSRKKKLESKSFLDDD